MFPKREKILDKKAGTVVESVNDCYFKERLSNLEI